ncbi:hypothetical protein ACQJBY_067017 [Aegilops geniculata]
MAACDGGDDGWSRRRRPGSLPADAPGRGQPLPPRRIAHRLGGPSGLPPVREASADRAAGPVMRSGRGIGRPGAGSEPPSMDFSQLGCNAALDPVRSPSLSETDPHTHSLTLCARAPLNPNPKPNQASSRCRIAGQSSRWPPRQFLTAAVRPATAVPLPWIRVRRWLGTVWCLSDAPSAPGGLVGRLQRQPHFWTKKRGDDDDRRWS